MDIQQGFTIIANSIFDDHNLSKEEFCLYIALIRFFNIEKGYSYPSYSKLKQSSKLGNDRTLIKAISGLVEKGYIHKEAKKGIGTKYFIPTIKQQYLSNDSTYQTIGAPTVKLQEHPLSNDSITNTNTNTKKKTSNAHSDFFETVWGLYPSKKGKGQVSDTQKAKIHKVGIEQITRCIDRYKKTKPDWQQYQNGSTFFSGGYVDYLDENYVETKKDDSRYFGERFLEGGGLML